MAYSFEPSHQYFQKMDDFQSMIEKELQDKARNLGEIDTLITQKIKQFQQQISLLQQDRHCIEVLANSRIHNIQCEMDWQERERCAVLENEADQDIREQEIDAEFENVPVVSIKRVKSKPTKKAKSASKSVDPNRLSQKTQKKVDKKFVLNVLHGNSKTTDKLPRFVIQQAKPKYKNSSL